MGEDYHPRMAGWVESAPILVCGVSQCTWAFVTSGLDTKGDVQDAYARHLARHDARLGAELDFLAEHLGGVDGVDGGG